jgi:hypothetical protein
VNKYNLKFKKLDILFASDIVGDGSGNIIGLLQTAQTHFYHKGIIPICIGGYREINKDFNKVIQQLAREAAAGHNGLTILPLINTDKKGGAYQIMLQQFRQAIAVTMANRHGSQILSRLHYVHATAKETLNTSKSHHSDNRWMPDQQG